MCMHCGIKETSAKTGVGMACRGSSQGPPCTIYYSKQGGIAAASLCWKAAQPIRHCSSPTNEKPPYTGLPVSCNRTLWVLQLLPSFAFPYKSKFPFLVCGFAYGIPQFTYPELQFLWLFQNKLAFTGKITSYYIIKVALKNRWSKYMNQKVTELKQEILKLTIVVGDSIVTCLSVIDKTSRYIINKDTGDLNKPIRQRDLILPEHSTQQQQNTHSFQVHTEHSPR